MVSFSLILFLICVFIPIYSYVIFPWYMQLKASQKLLVKNNYEEVNTWPAITVVFSVFNEEKVIKRKLESLLNTNYPKDKLSILIGSDNSTDGTHTIIESFIQTHSNIILINYNERQGKLKIINDLVPKCHTDYLIMTDANVFFEPNTLKALVYNLRKKEAQLVCGNILKFSPKNEGISNQEIFYMNFENQLKHNESINYNFCVGVEGGCYGIKKDSFVTVPDGFLMDDFFITLDVISKKGKVLFEPEALCYEDVNDEPLIEFKRKIRISLGNFRNLNYYKYLLAPKYNPFAFAFFSHKICRWITPFAILKSFVFSLILSFYFKVFILITIMYGSLIILPIATIYFEKHKIKIPFVNSIGHFLLMNLALFIGFFKFIKATNQSAWEPPKRNV